MFASSGSREISTDGGSYIEDKFETDPTFDVQCILAKDESYAGRLKYWTTELCQRRPHTFDFVVSVSLCYRTSIHSGSQFLAWGRWYSAVCQLVVPANCSTCPFLLPGVLGIPNQVRL